MTESVEPAVATRAPGGDLPLGAILLGAAVLGVAAVGVLGLDHLGFSICLLKAVTGIPCPTCGTTRMLGRLAAGDLAGAVFMNPLAAAATFLLVPWALTDLALLTRGRTLAVRVSERVRPWLLRAVVAAVLVNWGFLIATGR